MSRRHDVSHLNFDLRPWANRYTDADGDRHEVFGIDWECELGCGQWIMRIIDGKPHLLTEYMDRGDDKEFSAALLKALLEHAVVEE